MTATTDRVFFYLFQSPEDIAREFECELPTDIDILYAYYTYEDYSGNAEVIYRKDGKLYQVVGSHCSCYGLEGQWEPDEVYVKQLRMQWNATEKSRAGDRDWYSYSDPEIESHEALGRLIERLEQEL